MFLFPSTHLPLILPISQKRDFSSLAMKKSVSHLAESLPQERYDQHQLPRGQTDEKRRVEVVFPQQWRYE